MKSLLVYSSLVLFLLFAQSASATPIVWDFGTEFSGSGGTLSGNVRVTLDDGTPNVVDVTIDATGLNVSLSEYISGLYLNLNPSYNATSLSVGPADGPPVDWVSISLGTNAFKADGDGLYDIMIDYTNHQFVAGLTDTISFSLTGLQANDFDYLSAPAGGHGPYVAALRARSLGADGEDSGWFYPTRVPNGGPPIIPEPSSLLLIGTGIAGLGIAAWRRKNG